MATKAILFRLGDVSIEKAGRKALTHQKISPMDLIVKHLCGLWGEVSDETRRRNEKAMEEGGRIVSRHPLPDGQHVLVVTTIPGSPTERGRTRLQLDSGQ